MFPSLHGTALSESGSPALFAKMGNLFPFHPKVNGLRADSEKLGGARNIAREVVTILAELLRRRTNGRRRNWRRAFHRNGQLPVERRQLSGFVGFCGWLWMFPTGAGHSSCEAPIPPFRLWNWRTPFSWAAGESNGLCSK
jgi:hypothetical protein